MLQLGQLFSDTLVNKIKEETGKANTHMVIMFDLHKCWFSVNETMNHNEGRPRVIIE